LGEAVEDAGIVLLVTDIAMNESSPVGGPQFHVCWNATSGASIHKYFSACCREWKKIADLPSDGLTTLCYFLEAIDACHSFKFEASRVEKLEFLPPEQNCCAELSGERLGQDRERRI